jgi:hypothetical protein
MLLKLLEGLYPVRGANTMVLVHLVLNALFVAMRADALPTEPAVRYARRLSANLTCTA